MAGLLLLSAACDGSSERAGPAKTPRRSHPDRDAAVSVDEPGPDAATLDAAADPTSRDGEPPAQADAAAASDARVADPDPGPDAAPGSDAGPDPDASPDPDPDPPTPVTACGAVAASGSVLLELGHATSVVRIRQSASRIASQDAAGHWVLWNASTHDAIASGEIACPDAEPGCASKVGVELAGDVFLVPLAQSIELRSVSNGQLLTTITADPTKFGLAADGGYVWTATATALRAWSPNGTPLFTRSGNYAAAEIFAAASELRVAKGPAGADRIELVALDGTPSTTPAFSGEFSTWFLDGERFVARMDAVSRIYSKTAAQVQILSVPVLQALAGGSGDYAWFYKTNGFDLTIFRVDQASSAFEQAGGPFELFAMGSAVLMIDGEASPSGGRRTRVIDLGGSTPQTRELPRPLVDRVVAFAAVDAQHWTLGGQYGVLFDGAHADAAGKPTTLNCGAVHSIAGADNGRISVALAAGQVLHIALASRTLERVVPFSSSQVALSRDGGLLALAGNHKYDQYWADQSLLIYDMPAGTERNKWSYGWSTSYFSSFELARDARRVARVVRNGTDRIISTDLQGADPHEIDTGATDILLRLSPDGTRTAHNVDGQLTTQIHHDGVLEGAADGLPVGWLDDTHLLLQK
ncbi:MAG TPA: hypothetical protein VJR89_28910, partial [Polyangiales bacterium]|nr:hypothetical protein [Polyangiales bacterium]